VSSFNKQTTLLSTSTVFYEGILQSNKDTLHTCTFKHLNVTTQANV